MRILLPILVVIVSIYVCFPGWAQEQATDSLPQIEAPRRPQPEEQTGMLRGNKPFSLTTDPDGEFVYKFNEDNELETLEAKKGVVFTSEDMTLNADRLDYKAIKGELTASGQRVVVRQGDLIITCKLFKYYPDRQHSEFIGNAVVYNKTKDGKVQTTAADKIIVDIVDGKAQMKVQGAGRVRPKMSQAAAAPNVVATPGSGGARAMVIDGTKQERPPAGGVESGVSTPQVREESTTSALKVVAPISFGSALPAQQALPPKGTQPKPSERINPADRSQMEALSRTTESQ
ncbi:MAG: hypothetical protein N2Z21_05075 [Candidatus Sumerlaeaceae bacterium]|nr:hypothetical protein [Candidatus Sumerlaeaceae bacterium]